MASDDKILAEKADSLTKAVRKNEPASNIMPLLEYFKKIPPPNEDALRTTKIGVVIGKLRHHGDKEIKQTATEIVMKWKKSVDAAKKANRATQASPSGTPAAPSPAPASNSTNQPYKGDPEKRTFTSDGVDHKRTGDAVRDGCIGLLYNGLAYRSTESVEDVLMKAIEVEKAGSELFNGPTDAYRKKIRSLFQNLKNKSNRELGVKVMSGEITAVRFVKMTHDELKSADLRKQEKELEAENMKKAQVPMAEKSISTALTCGKCNQKKVSYTQAQTRSADEPMTTFCECLICGNRWKFS